MSRSAVSGPLRLDDPPCRHRALRAGWKLVRRPLARLLALPTLNRLYHQANQTPTHRSFVDRALAVLDVQYDVAASAVARVPTRGPLVIVANHPFGGLEGLILLSILRRVRPDVKVLGNAVLAAIPEMRDHLIFAHRFGGRGGASNVPALRTAVRWLEAGHALGVFPAGRVAHLQLRKRGVTDGPWSPSIARLLRRTGAPVLPVWFEGTNSVRFHLLGLVHPRLRTLMLPRELLRKRHSRVPVRVGNVVAPDRLAAFEDDGAMIDYLRMRTEILGRRSDPEAEPARHGDGRASRTSRPLATPTPADAAELRREITALPTEQVLLRQNGLEVVYAHAAQMPRALSEIGRLREQSFRHAGQGTGQPRDLHAVDQHYLHLLAWHPGKGEIVGSYRMGPTDHLLPRFGKHGLFTSTLFHYDEALLEQIDPALELGRAFVVPERQRDYAPLLMLWKGVGRFVVANPRYRVLFGSVSFGEEYQSLSRELLMAFLELNRDLPDMPELRKLRRFIHSRRPARPAPARALVFPFSDRVVRDIREVDELVSQVEADGRGVPVLLRQYLKLGARVLGFSSAGGGADESTLHALVLVDLVRADPEVLARYVGRDRASAFLAHHGRPALHEAVKRAG